MSTLWQHLTYRTPRQNPALYRRGLLGADMAGWRLAREFGPPPAVYFRHLLAGVSDRQLITNPAFVGRSPGRVPASTPMARDRAAATKK